MIKTGKILVIDDEPEVGEFVAATAQSLGLDCLATTDAGSLPELLAPDVTLILLDLMMPEMDGVEALRLLCELNCKAGIVLMSGISARVLETAERLATTLGLYVVGHLAKPFSLFDLEDLLNNHRVPNSSAPHTRSDAQSVPDEDLHAAIARNEFVLHFQPQINIASGKIIGVEALARWQHPDRGLIFPDLFISRMERLGLIDELGWLVADRALEEIKLLAEFNLLTQENQPLPRLALNVSVNSLCDLKFPDRFAAILKKHNTPPQNVILEITESGLINELANTLDVLTRLRVKNIKLSIDDFGTGYAMMQQLVNIPASELKIDRVFVMNMHINKRDRVMVEKSIEIGHELGMEVIAEGVETREQLNFLRKGGCDSAQGYLFTRPLPIDDLARWIEGRNNYLKQPS